MHHLQTVIEYQVLHPQVSALLAGLAEQHHEHHPLHLFNVDLLHVERQQSVDDEFTLRGTTAHLQGSGFYDNTSSIIVENGRWEFCSQPDFRGDCVTLGPGRYAPLDRSLTNRIESVRPLQVRGIRLILRHT